MFCPYCYIGPFDQQAYTNPGWAQATGLQIHIREQHGYRMEQEWLAARQHSL